jgi:hypothetical protein
MAMRRETGVQDDLVASWAEIPRSPGHAFYDRLQTLLKEAGSPSGRRATAHQRFHRPVDQGLFGGQAIWIGDRIGRGGATGMPVGRVTGEWLPG